MELLLLLGFYAMTFYAFLPGFISRAFGFKVFKRGKSIKEISLTFDDGPDPYYTEKVLDLLKKYDAKATFFVVGAHAEKMPEVLKRMKAEGHTIGIHNYEHKTNWLMRPKTVRKHIEMTNQIIEKATGEKSIYYRPPWGIVNIFDYAHLGHLNIILWSSLFGDWQKKLKPEVLKKRMLKKIAPGEVLLLHDCGRTLGADQDAPRNMLYALEAYLDEAKKQGFDFVGIDQMISITERSVKPKLSIIKRIIITIWLAWEHVFHVVMRLQKVGNSEEPVFHYRVTSYTGEKVILDNGQTLTKGDSIVELHFDNKKLSTLAAHSKSPVSIGVKMIREVEHALPVLAEQLQHDQNAKEIKAIYGVTMINRGADRLGFQIVDLPNNWFAKSSKIYLNLLMKVLTPSKSKFINSTSKSSKRRTQELTPKMLLMTPEKIITFREELIRDLTVKEIAISNS